MRVALALIVAVARNGVIGRGGALPWRLPEDLRRFRTLTTGHSVIMGRRTWESIARPLPGRQNIVVTRRPRFAVAGAVVAHSLDDALAKIDRPPPAFCIGGEVLFRAAEPRAQQAFVTEIDRDFDGDARFPPLDPMRWREVSREERSSEGDDAFSYAFVTYERIGDIER